MMDHSLRRELRISGDGSHTLYVPSLDETYHSFHGAIQESKHVFIENGLHRVRVSPLSVLEVGFGTGLNLLLTLKETEKSQLDVYYHTVEKYPLQSSEYESLNYEELIPVLQNGIIKLIHTADWGSGVRLTDHFTLFKERSDFREMDPKGPFDLVYFDAFAPDKQPHLWTSEIFSLLYGCMNPGGILVTYSSKGSVRRALNACGFAVTKLPGPQGKREMIRAEKS